MTKWLNGRNFQHCEKYNVNESNKNKVTFHKVAKAIMGLVENEDEDLLHIANSRQSFTDLFISNEFESTQVCLDSAS